MSLFLETIKINNGRRINLDGHNRRMNRTRNRHFHEIRDIDLKEEIEVPSHFETGVVRCRVVYGRQIEDITFDHYHFKNPRSFRVLSADHIDYGYKSSDRKALNQLFSEKREADDIIMTKEGFITDSFYANLALLKDGVWYTPIRPMLKGTFREKLVSSEKLVQEDIRADELIKYEAIKIFNALTEWEMHEEVEIIIGEHVFY